MKKYFRDHQSGRSMIEMVGVLAVSGLLTAGAFVLIQSGMESQKRSRTADEISSLVQNVRSLTAESDSFSKLPAYSSDGANGKNLAKALLKASTATAVTPFGGTSYYAITRASGTNAQFIVWVVGTGDCETMKLRSYSGGSADCDANGALKITYSR